MTMIDGQQDRQGSADIDTIIFDLGGVLIDWNPRHLYRKIFGDDHEEMEWFLAHVCSPQWNLHQDAGRLWREAIAEAQARHPEHAVLIRAYRERWEETMAGTIDGTVALLDELRSEPVRLLALTNWSAETFPIGRRRFPFLDWFEGIVVSGEEKLIKPDRAIYELLLLRYDVAPERAVFIDDSEANVAGARNAGLHAILFHDPATLRGELAAFGLVAA
jgi:2-haloacid dehalogenase